MVAILFLAYLAIISLSHELPSGRKLNDDSTDKSIDKLVYKMLITPDGKSINLTALKDMAEQLIEMDQSEASNKCSNNNNNNSKTILYWKAGRQRSALIDDYLIVGKEAADAKPLRRNSPCHICASAVLVSSHFMSLSEIWPGFIQLGKLLCPLITGFSQYACNGYVDSFDPIMFYLMPRLIKSPYALCGQFLRSLGCGLNADQPPMWQITLPDPPIGHITKISSGVVPTKNKLTVLFLADLHIDTEYEPGTAARCKEPLCCRKMSTPVNDPLPDNEKAGYWGDYRKCDVPTWAFDNILEEIRTSHANEIDYVFVAGDLTPHDTWNSTVKMSINAIDFVSNKIAEKLPGKPIFFAVGNHEAVPVNIFSLPGDPEQFSSQWLYDKLADVWMKWLDPQMASSTIKKGGFYTTSLKPGWRLISVNDNYCYDNDFLLLARSDPADPQGQLQWLVNTLTDAEKNGERVQIIGHIPPGSNDCLQPWSWNYYRIISRFSHIISGQFFGHTHDDFFIMYYDADTLTQPKSVAFVGPSGTPYSYHNMGYRLYDFNARNFILLNYRQYYADIEEANASGDKSRMPWKFHYSAREAYSLRDMSATSWDAFIKRMRQNSTLFDLRHRHYSLNYKSSSLDGQHDEKCTATTTDCRREYLCEAYGGLSNVPDTWCERFYPSKDPFNTL